MNFLGRHSVPFLFIVDFEKKRPLVFRLDEADEAGVLFDVAGVRNYDLGPAIAPQPLIFDREPVDFPTYRQAFEKVQYHLQRGDTYLLNLTFPSKIQTNYSLQELFLFSKAKYKLFFQDQFVLFSPEIFVQIDDGRISSHPMKGTIAADIQGAERLILDSEKEFSEHNTIVDLIRNDLSMVATDVRVDRFRYLDRLQTNRGPLLQVSSRISGQLPADYPQRIGDLLFTLLPAGSISGAPKRRTVEIIREAERYDRGYYTGVFGYFDGRRLDSAVMIRFIERRGDHLHYKSGGGITALSNLEDEYRELIQKIYVPLAGNHSD